jgi:predicted transposase YdaD
MLGINLEESRLYQQLKAEIEAKQAESEAKLRAESEQQGELKGKLAAVPLLLQAGISPDQIAAQLNLDPELIQEIMRSL